MQRCRKTIPIAGLLLPLLALLPGCALHLGEVQTAMKAPFAKKNLPSADDQTQKLIDLTKELDGRQSVVRSVTARLKVRYSGPGGLSADLTGVCIGDSSGNLRMTLCNVLGNPMIDVAVNNDVMMCWIPSRKSAQQGSRLEFIRDGDSEIVTLAALGSICDLFFPRPWAREAVRRSGETLPETATIWVYGGAPVERCLRKLSLEYFGNAVREQEVYNLTGERLGTIEYGEQLPLSKLSGSAHLTHAESALLVPRKIQMADALGRSRLAIDVENLWVNKQLPESVFRVQFPKDEPVQNLGERAGHPKFISPVAISDHK